MASRTFYRTTIRDSWRWMRWDIPVRLVPLAAVPVLYLWATRNPPAVLGLTEGHLLRDLALAIPCGLAGFAIAAAFSDYVSRRAGRWFVPDRADLLLQTLYYVVPNAFLEELFFRGFMQGMLVRWWQIPALGLTVTTLVFGTYHLLGRWGWRAVAGATVAGFALGLLYLWQPSPPSLLLPVIVHACITAGFLSLGPSLLFAWGGYRVRMRPQVEPPAPIPNHPR